MGDSTVKRVLTYAGPEQEYFLVDRAYYKARPDLRLTGRTVFGSMSAKGQEMDDHYFGAITDKVASFMAEINDELWKLGISAKTQHNEVAPHQYELATIYSTASIATDWNQLVMETMEKVAARHGLACLLHEKPFAGVNGSGKHINWNIGTDNGINLLKPGKCPFNDARFLLFFTSVIKAVDIYAPLLRAAAANAGNDHRLGANEAPPAIISIFLGSQLHDILEKLVNDEPVKDASGGTLEIGVTSLPTLPMDMTDRNRTSPFAFTGNKFEFRMGGSSQSVAGANIVLTTAMAEVLCQVADRLEKAKNVDKEIKAIILDNYRNHRRVIFNGNGYSQEWCDEAAARQLPNLRSSVEALKTLLSPESISLFSKHKVLSKEEVESRVTIYLETYSKQINIEAGVMKKWPTALFIPPLPVLPFPFPMPLPDLKPSGLHAVPRKII